MSSVRALSCAIARAVGCGRASRVDPSNRSRARPRGNPISSVMGISRSTFVRPRGKRERRHRCLRPLDRVRIDEPVAVNGTGSPGLRRSVSAAVTRQPRRPNERMNAIALPRDASVTRTCRRRSGLVASFPASGDAEDMSRDGFHDLVERSRGIDLDEPWHEGRDGAVLAPPTLERIQRSLALALEQDLCGRVQVHDEMGFRVDLVEQQPMEPWLTDRAWSPRRRTRGSR